jgi:hypothetical protein
MVSRGSVTIRKNLAASPFGKESDVYEKSFQDSVVRSAGGDVHDGIRGGQAELS